MFEQSYFVVFFLLICGHAIGDFALQNEWVALNKERVWQLSNTKRDGTVWPYLLTAHSLHHGLIVFLITQKISLGIAETCAHWLIDFGKGEKIYGFHIDQILHLFTKAVWLFFLYYGIV